METSLQLHGRVSYLRSPVFCITVKCSAVLLVVSIVLNMIHKHIIKQLTGGDQHGDAFLHILCLGDETTTSHTFAIETDLLLEAVLSFSTPFLCLMLARITSSFLGISPACSLSY